MISEAKQFIWDKDFKGYIHDVGGPTANFRFPSCEKQLKDGVCPNRKCLAPKPCKNLRADHAEYIELLSRVEQVPGVKRVFVRSGIRFDYLLADEHTGDAFFKKLVRDHVSGQLKVAPEHCAPNVLRKMGKPDIEVFEKFKRRYFELSNACGKESVPRAVSDVLASRLYAQ